MTALVIIWDHKDDPPDDVGAVLCWRSYLQRDQFISIPRYLEDNAERLRARYLAFIYDLGESRIGGKRVVEHLEMGDGFSFWWMTNLAEKSPFKSPRIYDCLRLLALEEILLDGNPSDLTLHSSDQDLVQAIKQLCQNLHIHFVLHSARRSKQKWSFQRLYHSLPHPIQGLISLRHVVLRWALRKLRKPQWFSGENAVFLCSYFIHLDPASCAEGRFYSWQWGPLTKHLYESGRLTNWIQHFLFSPVVPSVKTGLGWLRLFNLDPKKQGYHAFLETYLSWSVLVKALKNWFRLNAVSWRLRRIKSAFYANRSAVWLWPMLRNEWLSSIKGTIAISNCLWVELFDAALKNMPHQKIGFYLWENQGWENALLRAWRLHGHGDIIGVPHATVVFWNLQNFDDARNLISNQNGAKLLPNRLTVNGPSAWETFAKASYPAEQLVEVEALRYLNLSQKVSKTGLDSLRRSFINSQISELPRINVLILGDMIPSAMHNLLTLLEDTTKLLPSGYNFTFKPHPGYAVCLTDYPDLHANETSDALDKILGQYDMVLAANSTSAAVDAYLAGLPVIIALDGETFNLSPLRGHSGVQFVSTPDELADALLRSQKPSRDGSDQTEFFFLDPELPRWKRLLTTHTPIIVQGKVENNVKTSQRGIP